MIDDARALRIKRGSRGKGDVILIKYLNYVLGHPQKRNGPVPGSSSCCQRFFLRWRCHHPNVSSRVLRQTWERGSSAPEFGARKQNHISHLLYARSRDQLRNLNTVKGFVATLWAIDLRCLLSTARSDLGNGTC